MTNSVVWVHCKDLIKIQKHSILSSWNVKNIHRNNTFVIKINHLINCYPAIELLFYYNIISKSGEIFRRLQTFLIYELGDKNVQFMFDLFSNIILIFFPFMSPSTKFFNYNWNQKQLFIIEDMGKGNRFFNCVIFLIKLKKETMRDCL